MTNEILPELITIGEKYGPAMEIQDQVSADAYFERLVQHGMRFHATREKAEEVERANLGYFAGYYSEDTRSRVERLFRCAHPIFGSIADHGAPTMEEALGKGQEMARTADAVARTVGEG
jgi:hypothetical protein